MSDGTNPGHGSDDPSDIDRGMRNKCYRCQRLYFESKLSDSLHCEVCFAMARSSAEPEEIGCDFAIFLPGGRRGRFVIPSLTSPTDAIAVTKQLKAIVKIISAQGMPGIQE